MKKLLQAKMIAIEKEIMLLEEAEKLLLSTQNDVLTLYNLASILEPLRAEKMRLQNIEFMLIDIWDTNQSTKENGKH
jgi:hypothetical protein